METCKIQNWVEKKTYSLVGINRIKDLVNFKHINWYLQECHIDDLLT